MTKFTSRFRSKSNTQTGAMRRRVPYGLACLIAVIAGAMFSLSLAPYHFAIIAIFSPSLLYLLLKDSQNSRQAFWIGQLYGFGTWAVGAFWLYHSIYQYGGVSTGFALVLIGLMAMIMGLFHALMSWVFVHFTARQPLSFAGLWVIQEWLKTWVLTGFPWLFVGYAFTEAGWVNGVAPIFGVLGLSFLAVLLAGSLVELFYRNVGYLLTAASLWFLAALVSFIDISWTTSTTKSISVSLIQGNIPQDLKWREGFAEQTLGIYAGLSQPEWGRDLVVWPEAAIPMFQDEAAVPMSIIAKHANDVGSVWLTGILYRQSNDANNPILYNSVLLHDQGRQSVYHKQQLVPFGEYIPFGGLIDILPALEKMQGLASLSRGSINQAPLVAKGQKLGMAICYEVAYPDTTRHNAKDSGFLLTVSNDAWFGKTAGPLQHLQMVQMRSLETGRWFVRATNNGVTALIDHKGRIISRLPQFERNVLRGKVPSYTGNTPYMFWGSYPILVASIILVLLSVLANGLKNTSARREKYYTADGVADR